MTVELDAAEILARARALAPEIRAAADRVEAERRIPDDLLARLVAAGVFRIAMPRAWLDDAVARALYPSLDARTAGLLFPAGQAHVVPGGFRVSGQWAFGSGSLHADRLVGGCLLFEDGKPRLGAQGRPEWRIAYLAPGEVEILDTWRTTGLAGSGSHDYRAKDARSRRAIRSRASSARAWGSCWCTRCARRGRWCSSCTTPRAARRSTAATPSTASSATC